MAVGVEPKREGGAATGASPSMAAMSNCCASGAGGGGGGGGASGVSATAAPAGTMASMCAFTMPTFASHFPRFMGIGAGGPSSEGLHTPTYDFNDDAIPHGVAYWMSLVQQELGPVGD